MTRLITVRFCRSPGVSGNLITFPEVGEVGEGADRASSTPSLMIPDSGHCIVAFADSA